MTIDSATPATHLVSDPHGLRFETDVAAHPATTARLGGRIVVGIHGSDSSIAAARYAIKLADALDGTVVAVTSWMFPDAYGAMMVAIDSPADNARGIADDATNALFGNTRPDWFSADIVQGTAGRALIEASQGAEMLVVGGRGHSGLAGLLLGSVSAHCAENAACPVLVVH